MGEVPEATKGRRMDGLDTAAQPNPSRPKRVFQQFLVVLAVWWWLGILVSLGVLWIECRAFLTERGWSMVILLAFGSATCVTIACVSRRRLIASVACLASGAGLLTWAVLSVQDALDPGVDGHGGVLGLAGG